ncbi:MAG: hypothetical protein KAY32_15930, partial [Candidatus Eisenbacteria sp.]|nr:hypothetical protein [Candidatus Eisenbacteria bacterium]
MKHLLSVAFVALLLTTSAMAATEETKEQAIQDGLAWIASTQSVSGSEGWWSYSNDGTLAATGAAALAFVEEGHWHPDSAYYVQTMRALTYMFNRALVDSRFGVETAVSQRYAEDYNNDGDYTNDGGNDQAIYFEPGNSDRRVYTTGICVPVVFALGEALGPDTVIGMGSPAVSGMTYRELMQDLVDWFCWGQVEPDRGNYRGGWRYDANYPTADNSTAQWGALPMLYGEGWGMTVPPYVKTELDLWVTYIQNANGGSGYDSPSSYVNVSKTGGLLLEFAALGRGLGDSNVQAALAFIDSRWNTTPSSDWYGNLNHPYAMWAVYKALSVYGLTDYIQSGCPTLVDILVGIDMPAAPGGFTIGFDCDPHVSAAGDWFSHYCDYLVGIQNANGSWNGYSYWTGAMATGWYVNIINATGVPDWEPCVHVIVGP